MGGQVHGNFGGNLLYDQVYCQAESADRYLESILKKSVLQVHMSELNMTFAMLHD